MAKAEKWEELEKNVISLRWILFKRALFYKSFLQIKHWAIYIYGQIKKFLFPSCGLFIILIGPDGSGKTTTAKAILESEIRRFFQRKMYFHGHFPFLPELKKIVAFFKKNRNKVAVLSSPENPGMILEPFGFFRSIIYPLYYGINYFLGHILIWKERARGGRSEERRVGKEGRSRWSPYH